MPQKHIAIGNHVIAYESFGSGPAAVFLHGWGANGALWKPFTERFASARTVYLFDLPGFGMSPAPQEALSIGDYAAIVHDACGALGIDPPDLIGHSFGARIAAACAARYSHNVRTLTLIAAGGHRPRLLALKKLLAKIAKPFFAPRVMRGARRAAYRAMGAEDYIAAGIMRDTFIKTIDEPMDPIFAGVKTPTLILWGEHDSVVPVRYGNHISRLIPGAELALIPDAGHFCFIDNPASCAQYMLRFIT
jgi:pimeloyl-ACP methyl ester carboxylesterase